jgi:hypothetical protein
MRKSPSKGFLSLMLGFTGFTAKMKPAKPAVASILHGTRRLREDRSECAHTHMIAVYQKVINFAIVFSAFGVKNFYHFRTWLHLFLLLKSFFSHHLRSCVPPAFPLSLTPFSMPEKEKPPIVR